MPLLLLGLLLVVAIHSIRIAAPDWCRARIASMGEGGWKGLFSAASLTGPVTIIWGCALPQASK